MSVRLTIIRGPKAGESYEFDADVITIGSGRNNDVILYDNDVSTNHCRLLHTQNGYTIEDLGSRYGTFVEGQPITEGWILQNGSIIELGGQVALEYLWTGVQQPEIPHQPILMKPDDPGSEPCLVLVQSGEPSSAYLLQSQEITVGRSVDNDIVVQETDISRVHMRLVLEDNRYHIADMNSRNGTFINSVPVTNERIELSHGDVIRLGSSVQLHFVYRSDLPADWDPLETRLDTAENSDIDLTTPAMRVRKTEPVDPALLELARQERLEDHILVTYAREDWESVVAPIVMNLNDSKQRVWVEQHLRPGSEEWRAATERAVMECWLMVLVVSPAAMQSDHVRDQYRYFYNREKPILLVDYKPVERLPIQLTQLTRVEYNPETPGVMLRQLLAEILTLKPN